jgi:2-dehydropantoate 2-reductase
MAGKQCGFPLPAAAALDQVKRTELMGAYKPSTLIDFEAGRPLEIEAIWGEPLRRAQEAGAVTPRLEELYEKLKAIDSRRPGKKIEAQTQA